MIKLIKNTHSAAMHLPPAKHMPEVTLFPGVTAVGETRWSAAKENMTVCRWLKAGVLVELDPEAIAAPTEEPAARTEEPALRTTGGEGSGGGALFGAPPTLLPPLSNPKGGKK